MISALLRLPLAFLSAALLASTLCPLCAVAGDFVPAPLTLQQLLDRIKDAGGSLPPGAYCRTKRTVATVDHTVTNIKTCWDKDGYVTTSDENGFTWTEGEYRGRDWTQNPNGLVTLSSDYYSHVDPFVVAMSRSDDPDSGVRLLGSTGGPSPQYVVEIAPRSGLVEHDFYDATTSLLMRVEQKDYDGHTRWWTYGDYRPEHGALVAHAIEYGNDPTVKTSVSQVLTYQKVSPDVLHLEIPASRPLFDLAGRDAVIVPAKFTGNGIIVRVSIAGRGLDFMLDSGASAIVIDPGVAAELGMRTSGVQRVSFAGDYSIGNTRAPDFQVGELYARDVAVSATSFEEPLQGAKLVGLLGADFVGTGVLEVNFEHQTLTLHAALPPNLAAQGWSMIPILVDDDVPLVKATFSGLDGHFIADLGADESMLFPHYFSQFHITVPRGTEDQGYMETVAGQAFGIKHFTMNQLVLGDWIFGNVNVTVPSTAQAQMRDYDGLLGRDMLKNFNLIFDYKDRQLWFKPLDVPNATP